MHLAWRVFLPFAAGYFLSYLLRNVNAVIAPDLTRELGVSAADLGLLTSAYLLTFSTFQLPLGILLDRYGPRRVEAALLLLAAAGCAGFALGDSLGGLAAARGLIGLGVCACLMASFKAFSVWYPPQRLPALNASVMVAGGLGALSATTPLAWAAPLLGWRGLFLGLAALAMAAAVAIFLTPEKPGPRPVPPPLATQVRELGAILRSRVFWRYAPQTTLLIGGFVALQGLWAMDWLVQVEGLTRAVAAHHLLLTTVAMVVGFLGTALFIGPLGRRGITPDHVLGTGALLALACMGAVLAGVRPTTVPWFLLGLTFATGNIAYAQLASHFPAAQAGRVNTALNLCAFVGAFALQWGYGALMDLARAHGQSPAQAHRGAFMLLLGLQAAGVAWYLLGARRSVSGAFRP